MKATHCILMAAFLSAVGSAEVTGQQDETPREEFTVGVSYHDVSGRLGKALAVEVGYRPAWNSPAWLRPEAGGMASWDGAAYAFVGIFVPFELPGGVRVAPSLGAGAFEAGKRTDLGSVLEFRSGISLTLPVPERYPLSIVFYHLSNAGLRRPNPGMEVIELSYAVRW